MDETQAPARAAARADVAWGSIRRRSESGSFIEDQLAALVCGAARPARFRVDVIHIDPDKGQG